MSGDNRGSKPKKLGALTEMPMRSSKLRGMPAGALEALSDDQVCSAVVKVEQENYVPPGVTPVSQISPRIFTARLTAADIRGLEADPLIVSVELSRPVGPVEP